MQTWADAARVADILMRVCKYNYDELLIFGTNSFSLISQAHQG